MRAIPIVCAAFALCLTAAPTLADTPMQPPMTEFNQAFYTCEGGGAFMMSYDSEQPTTAEMTNNADGKHHQLKRTQAASGVEFKGAAMRFWTDGKTVVVEGASAPFKNCRKKPG
jgi:membrane-bound inhibitor of C-type lysozyme